MNLSPTVKQLTGNVGAQIVGVDLTQPISDELADLLRDTLYNNAVLVVKNQQMHEHLDAHERVAEVFGEPFTPWYYAAGRLEGHPHTAVIPNFGKAKAPAEGWHTDWSHFPVPPTVSVAIGAVIPPAGGDTMFCNQYVSYERLSSGMKEFLDDKRAKFVGSRPLVDRKMDGTPDTLRPNERVEVINFHPIVRIHPETGRKALYLNRPGEAVIQIEGLTEEESLPILQFLHERSSNPDNVYRHRWDQGDLVAWDNRCAMHYGVHDYGDIERTLHRITVGGQA